MRKRGQITLFIILGIVLLIVISVSIMLFEPSDDTSTVMKSTVDIAAIRNFVDLCVNQVTLEGLVYVSYRGGYYDIPQKLNLNDSSLWYDGHNVQPFLSEFKKSFYQFVDENLDMCINELEYFKMQGFEVINPDKIKVTINFGQTDVYGKISYPGRVTKGDFEHKLSDFAYRHQIRLKELYEMSSEFVNQISQTSFDRCNPLSCMVIPSDVEVTYQLKGDQIILDSEIEINSTDATIRTLNMRFASRVDFDELFEGDEYNRLAVLADDGVISNIYALEVLDAAAIDYDLYSSATSSDLIPRLSYYDVILITGNFLGKYTANDFIDSGISSYYYFFVEPAIKSWVRDGGVLWINDPGENLKYYLDDGPFITLHQETQGCTDCVSHTMTKCPNDISAMLNKINYAGSTSLSISDYPTEVIVGSRDEALVWAEYVGNGLVLYDHASMDIADGIRFEDRDDRYFENVLNYLNAASTRLRGELYESSDS